MFEQHVSFLFTFNTHVSARAVANTARINRQNDKPVTWNKKETLKIQYLFNVDINHYCTERQLMVACMTHYYTK